MTARPPGPPDAPSAEAPTPTRQPARGRQGWIRWPGLIAFLLVVAAAGGLWFLLVDAAIERAIERTGTTLVGARVDLDAADLSLVPLGLTLTRLQVANPDRPMTNAVEIARIAFTMDGLNLLRRKVIIEEMAVDGLRLGTPRASSGAVATPAEPAEERKPGAPAGVTLPSLQFRDPREILASESLESLTLVEAIRADMAGARERWQKQLAALPDKAKLEGYRQRLEKLTSAGKGGLGGILSGAEEALAVRQDLQRDLERLQAARKELEASVALLRKRVEEAQRAPQEDFRRLRDKYALSPEGLGNLSAGLLGSELGDRIRAALQWYRRLQPLLARQAERKAEVEVVKPLRGKGLDVRFKERAPLPDLLIRTAHVSLEIPQGTVMGEVRNITPDQDILGAPLTFEFAREKLQGLQSLKLTGSVDRVRPASPQDRVSLLARGVGLDALTLGEGSDWPLTLRQGTADLDLHATVAGRALTADVAGRLKSLRLALAPKPDGGPIREAVGAALADLHGFSLKADVTGTVDRYDIKLTSDLDRVLQEAVGKQVRAQAAKFEAQLQSAIQERVSGPLKDLTAGLGGLDGLAGDLAGRFNLGHDLLKQAKPGAAGGTGGFRLPF